MVDVGPARFNFARHRVTSFSTLRGSPCSQPLPHSVLGSCKSATSCELNFSSKASVLHACSKALLSSAAQFTISCRGARLNRPTNAAVTNAIDAHVHITVRPRTHTILLYDVAVFASEHQLRNLAACFESAVMQQTRHSSKCSDTSSGNRQVATTNVDFAFDNFPSALKALRSSIVSSFNQTTTYYSARGSTTCEGTMGSDKTMNHNT